MLAAPPITIDDFRKQLEAGDWVRIPATADDYFDLLDEQADDVYLELYSHHLIARPNVNTENHELVTASIIRLLGNALLDQPQFRVMGSNRPVYVKDCALGFAPDVLVVKGPTELYPRKKAMAATLNPWLMVEVMSESNRNAEFLHKLSCYKKIPALNYVLLIEPDYTYASLYSRTTTANQWLNTDYFHLDDIVVLDGLRLPLTEIYRSVVFVS
ncbi:MAG: Uma2 family endonuclease [Rudanella sp.]|nr:Uma2 family endonuclease [Rudanella sp.]